MAAHLTGLATATPYRSGTRTDRGRSIYLAAVFTNLFAEIAAACASDRFDLETRQRHPEQWRYTQCLAVSRYSGSEKAADSLRLCRETVWQDGPGETLVQALGQRVWLTGHGDISLLDLSTCTFNTAEGSDA